ncbi:phosphotransferase enzyme family protein [Chitinophaga filiformis]|nr:phosphotransferase [Chitinophaga filiformis]
MQTVFPTLYSTLSPTALATYISQQYTFGPLECKFIVRGVGDTYLVSAANERFILRIYRPSHRTLANIQAEVELLTALHTAEVSVSYPLADKDGHYIQSLPGAEGTRHAVLFSYAEGRSHNILSDVQLRNFGQEMARFHNISSQIQLSKDRWTFDLETTLFQPLAAVKDYFSEDPATYDWLLQSADKVKTFLSQLDTSRFSYGYCHFDFLPKNFHFDSQDNITFFDFDFFGTGWLAYDLMTFHQQLLLDMQMGRLTAEQRERTWSLFVEAYRSERALSEEELAAIPYLGLGFWVFYMGFHATHDQFYPLMQTHMLQGRFAVVRKLLEHAWEEVGIVASTVREQLS